MARLIAGVDEAGRGPIAGPVVASAAILPEGLRIEGVRDSKRLSEKRREELLPQILEEAIAVSTGIVHEDDIDRMNILVATRKAMRIALGRLDPQPDEALIDGFGLPDQIVRNRGVLAGDEKIHVISAASIIAKVTRDRIMHMYHEVFPKYNFGKHKGYGTPEHLKNLREQLACPIHRKSFHPVQHYLPTLSYLKKKRLLGPWGEKLAARELVHNGYEIVAMNYSAHPYGEIDIVARNIDTTVFVEVKTAGQGRWGKPEAKLDAKKIRSLATAFEIYMSENEGTKDCRFDLITVRYTKPKPTVRHYEDCLN